MNVLDLVQTTDRNRRIVEFSGTTWGEKRTPRVLIADDDPALRLLAREALSETAMVLEQAEDGFETLQKILRQPADHTAEDARQVAQAGDWSLALTEELSHGPEAFPGYFEAGTP